MSEEEEEEGMYIPLYSTADTKCHGIIVHYEVIPSPYTNVYLVRTLTADLQHQ